MPVAIGIIAPPIAMGLALIFGFFLSQSVCYYLAFVASHSCTVCSLCGFHTLPSFALKRRRRSAFRTPVQLASACRVCTIVLNAYCTSHPQFLITDYGRPALYFLLFIGLPHLTLIRVLSVLCVFHPLTFNLSPRLWEACLVLSVIYRSSTPHPHSGTFCSLRVFQTLPSFAFKRRRRSAFRTPVQLASACRACTPCSS